MRRRIATSCSVLRMSSPQQLAIVQRAGAAADIAVAGTYSGADKAIGAVQGRYGAAAPSELTASVSGGALSGTLASCAQGQGLLRMWSSLDPNAQAAVHIGIGDVFAVAGQSNAEGSANNYQDYAHATLLAGMYTSSTWSNLRHRSPWPGVATAFMADQAVPIGFAMTAVGSTTIAMWQPTAAEGYYDALVSAITAVGGVKAVLWWQGESDVSAGTAEATYNAGLDTVANALYAAAGVRMIVAQLQTWGSAGNLAAIRSAISTAWSDNDNVVPGPDFSDLTPSDGPHFVTDEEIAVVAARWWAAIDAGLY